MKRLWRVTEFLAWAAFFAFAALVLVLRFWLLPDIERYRERIVAAVSKTVGQPVKIGRIEAGWLGLNPQLSLQDVQIFDAQGREALVLPVLENVISWKSLFTGDLHLQSLVIEAPRLAVRRDASGTLSVAGIKLAGGARGERTASDWVLAQDEIEIRNAEIEWFDEKRGAPPLVLSGLNLRLRNFGNEHSLGLSARPPAQLGSTLDLRAQISGHPVSGSDLWNGRVFLELGYTDLAGWRAWVDYPVDVRQGQGALRLWTTLENGEITQATADVALSGVSARLGKDLPLVELAALTGRLHAATRQGGYEVAGRKLALVAERGAGIEPTDFQLSWQPAGKEPEKGSLAAKQLELAPLVQLAEALPLPAPLRRRLAELAPKGRLTDAKLDWSGSLAEPAKLSGKARFAELALRPSGELPGFSGLSGTIDASEARGRLQLASRKAELELPQVLSSPRVALDTLEGSVDWERTEAQGVSVRIASLAFANADLEGRASGTYTYPGFGRGTIDMEAALRRAEGSKVPQYLPRPEVIHNKEVHQYLSRAILGGKASDVHLRLKGDLRDFPFVDPAKGHFRVTARVEKGVLEYVPGWPRIQDIDAELLFERDRMEIVGRSASVLGARLADVRVAIPAMRARNVVLAVTGQADGPSGEFLKFIRASPVQRMTGGFTDAMQADGRGKLRLKLELPLHDLDATRVAGEFDLNANSLTVHANLPPVERASARVSFTESTFAFQDFKGRFLGGPVTVSGASKPGAGVELRAHGDATVAGTQAIFDHPWRRYFSGAAPYSATVSMRDGRTRITFESSLRGVSSTLPPPFAKSAAESLPLRVDVIPAEGGARDRISIAVARIVAAELLRRRQGEAMVVQRAGISLSPAADQAVRVPERPGTLVYGSLAELDLDRWLGLASAEPAKALPGGAAEAAAPTSYELRIGTLDAFGKRIHGLDLRAGSDAGGWSATVNADEMAGDLSYRAEKGGQLIARMAHFRIPADYPGATSADGAGRARELPSVDLVAERFTYKDKQLGRIEIVAQRANEDWRIERLMLVNTEASVTGKGVWRTGAVSSTSVNLDLESSDGGLFLERLGYPGLVRGARSKMQAALTWAGDPVAIDYPTLSGNVQLQSEDGQFLEIEPGLGKLVSLMSLQMLPKRLSLDFRDVFSKGFQFDRIAASADIERGVMKIRDFKMRGSAADVELSGEVDLAKETQNLRARVMPQLGDTASTVLAFINPLLLFPAAIAQRILKDPLGHIFAFNYSITGTWADPKVVKRGVEAEELPAKKE